jgi:flagellar protein FlbD
MILVTRPDGSTFYLNPELIETIEETPHTVITLQNKKKLVVKDSAQELVDRFVEYKRKTHTLLESGK